MKALVFSDSHGATGTMRRALAMHPDAEVVFFLGDGLSDFEAIAEEDARLRAYLPVRGNCDFSGTFRGTRVTKTEEITLEGRKIVYTHGDLYGVKYGEDGLLSLAARTGADIVLFGHTHEPNDRAERVPVLPPDGTPVDPPEERLVRLFNPGAASFSYGESPTFGILTLTENAVLFSVGSTY